MNVAVLTSPLQIFNFIEYRNSVACVKGQSEWTVILPIQQNYPEGLGSIRACLVETFGCEVHFFRGLPGNKKFCNPLKRILLARKYILMIKAILGECESVQKLAIGDYRSRECRHVMSYCRDAKITLLDDGSATHQIATYLSPRRGVLVSPMFPRMNVHGLLLSLGGVRLSNAACEAFFTHYLSSVDSFAAIIPHRYAYWRSQVEIRNYQYNNDILFLGMSHVESGITSESDYFEALRLILSFYGTKRVLYRPHRKECKSKLIRVQRLGFEVLDLDVTPIEYLFTQADVLPEEIASIASSCLDNLPVIFKKGLSCRCFVPFEGYQRGPLVPHFNQILDYHIKHSSQNRLKITYIS